MNPEIVIPEVAAIAAGFLLIPSAVIAATGTRRTTVCPESGGLVQLRLDRGRSVKRLFTDSRHAVCDCTRWPERAGCDQACTIGLG